MKPRPKFEVADVFRLCREKLGLLSAKKNKVINAILNCRTEKLGGHVYACDNPECGHEEQSYNSCRDRHCPKCQYSAKKSWVEDRVSELLPVPYFHTVFTMPHLFNELAFMNPKELYRILFWAAQESVKQLFKERYKSIPGLISILHTWGSNITFHSHIHMLVTGGGISETGDRWISALENYCLPVKALSKIFRAKFVEALRKSYKANKLRLPENLKEPFAFEDFVESSFKTEWVVYTKKPFAAPIHVLNYLGNYTHRVAFSNHRIVNIENGQVTFKYKAYHDGTHENKIMSLSCEEFCRRFLMHILPAYFVKIRFSGIFAHKNRKKNIEKSRELIAKDKRLKVLSSKDLEAIVEEFAKKNSLETDVCKKCQKGKMIKIKETPNPTWRKSHNTS